MATEMITMKIEKNFLKEIDQAVKQGNYQSRAELIRESLRKNLDEKKMDQAMKELAHLKGAGKTAKQATDEEIHKIREQVFEEFYRKDFDNSSGK